MKAPAIFDKKLKTDNNLRTLRLNQVSEEKILKIEKEFSSIKEETLKNQWFPQKYCLVNILRNNLRNILRIANSNICQLQTSKLGH